MTLAEEIATFVENWSSAPPNPSGRRAELARDIRKRFGGVECDLLASCRALLVIIERDAREMDGILDTDAPAINAARAAIKKGTAKPVGA